MAVNIAIQPSDLKTRTIPYAPDTFNGLRSGYIAQWLDPVLPDVSEVDRLHHLLARYVQSQSAALLVRHVTGMERGTVYQTLAGALLKATDNAPAWWWHSVLFNRVRVDSDNLSCFIEATPWHFHQTGKWTTINHSGWHAAHIFDVKDGDTDWRSWSRESAVRRFIRNIHPCNVFFVPKTEWQRVGADPELIAAVAAHYRRRHASVWVEFLRLAQGEPQLGDGAVDGPLVIGSPPAAVRNLANTPPTAKRLKVLAVRGANVQIPAETKSPLIPLAESQLGPKYRKWRGTDEEGLNTHHGVVSLSESPVDMRLRWRRSSSAPTRVIGCFRLELEGLLAEGYVREEDSRPGHVRLKFVHNDNDDCIYVQKDRGGPALYVGRFSDT